MSSWKRHWMAHRAKWMVAMAAAGLLTCGLFAVWAFQVTVGFYASQRQASVQPTPHQLAPARPFVSADKSVVGPVRFELQVDSLELGEQVIVARDTSAIIRSRLEQAGIELNGPTTGNVLTLFYTERPGDLVEVSMSDGKTATGDALLRGIQIRLRLTLDRPDKPLFVLGEGTAKPPQQISVADAMDRQSVTRQQRMLYQQTYQQALAFLRRVDLPVVR